MITVYSNNFSWRKTQGPGTLVAKLEMGSFEAVKKVILIYADKCWKPLKLGANLKWRYYNTKMKSMEAKHQWIEKHKLYGHFHWNSSLQRYVETTVVWNQPLLNDNLRIRLNCIWNWNIFLLLRKAINKKMGKSKRRTFIQTMASIPIERPPATGYS